MRLLEVGSHGSLSFTRDFQCDEIPPYAILSHTWGDPSEEVTYQDVLSGSAKTKNGYRKISFCAEQAQRDGLQHVWIDTCCIDKTNLVELSEAINSMFMWYAQADLCYAHLADVSSERSDEQEDYQEHIRRQMRHSRWFTRGWTLQELIAPSMVRLYSNDGNLLGDKTALKGSISEITGIPVAALECESLATFSITERISWQDSRRTTKEEDKAYALLGICGVHMPLLYGEGQPNAFRRLKEEIELESKGKHREDFAVTLALNDVVAVSSFVARRHELDVIRQALISNGDRRSTVIHGLGGMGKTQLMVAYAKAHRHDYSAVFWINATDLDSIKRSFAEIRQQILHEHPSANDQGSVRLDDNAEKAVDAVRSWLSLAGNTRWLLLIDNLDNPRVPGNPDPAAVDIREYLPRSDQGSVIITTRSAQLKIGHSLHLDKFKDIQDGLDILSDISKRQDVHSSPAAIDLAKKLDGLPLALATAGAYLEQSSMSFSDYTYWHEDAWLKLQHTSPSLMSYEDRTLYSTWQVSFDQVRQRNSLSASLLCLWAYFDSNDLWYELLYHKPNYDFPEEVKEAIHPAWMKDLTQDILTFHEALRVLCDHGLAAPAVSPEQRVESGGYSIHNCVHSWTRSVLNAEWNPVYAAIALECVASHVPDLRDDRFWLTQRRILGHAPWPLRGRPIEAIPASVQTFHSLGMLYRRVENFSEAEKMYLEGIRRSEIQDDDETLGPNTMNNLGVLYAEMGNYAKAEEMYQQAFRRTEIGGWHWSDYGTLSNLAMRQFSVGKLVEARDMCIRALEGKQKTLGTEHESTLLTLGFLGDIYWTLKNLDEAEKLLVEAHEGLQRRVGAHHPHTIKVARSLGNLYEERGNYEKAEKLYRRSLTRSEDTHGPEHEKTLRIVINLASLCKDTGKLSESERLFLRVLQACAKREGADGMELAIELGAHCEERDRIEEGIEIYRQALPRKECTDLLERQKHATLLSRLGNALRRVLEFEEAESLLLQSLYEHVALYGPDHVDTLHPIANLGVLYSSKCPSYDLEKAREMCRRAWRGKTELPAYVQEVIDGVEENIREVEEQEIESADEDDDDDGDDNENDEETEEDDFAADSGGEEDEFVRIEYDMVPDNDETG